MKVQNKATFVIAQAGRPGIKLRSLHFTHRSPAFAPVLSKNFCIAGFIFLTGCGSMATTQPSASQKQDDALNDPMGYKPNVSRDISGGDITHFDHSGFNKDLNDALNP